jgi:hypothetical protein
MRLVPRGRCRGADGLGFPPVNRVFHALHPFAGWIIPYTLQVDNLVRSDNPDLRDGFDFESVDRVGVRGQDGKRQLVLLQERINEARISLGASPVPGAPGRLAMSMAS